MSLEGVNIAISNLSTQASLVDMEKGAKTASRGTNNNDSSASSSLSSPTLTEEEKQKLEKQKQEKEKQEKETRFEKNFGYRKLSARWFIEEAFGEETKELRGSTSSPHPPNPIPSTPECVTADNQASVGYHDPPESAPAYDVIGDAMFTVFQKLFAAREIPVEHCHWMAYWIVHEADKKGKTQFAGIPYDKDAGPSEISEDAEKYFADKLLPTVAEVAASTDEQCDILRDRWTGLHVVASQTKGNRKTQEDRICVYPNGLYMNRDPEDKLPLLAVFDGHGGHEHATYAAAHLWETWLQIRKDHPKDSHADWLQKTLVLLGERLDKRAILSNWRGGSTAVICTLDMKEGVASFAWLGDSLAFILSDTNCRKVIRDHWLGDEKEEQEYKDRGGKVPKGANGDSRASGVLAVSRALGDIGGRPAMSNEPEIEKVQLDVSDYLVILTSDGVTDTLTPGELYATVQAFCIQYGVEYYQQLADYITEEGCKGSKDNASVVICFLRPPKHLWTMMLRDPDDSDYSDLDCDELGGEEETEEAEQKKEEGQKEAKLQGDANSE